MNENIKLPEGWKVVRLGEVAERITNGFVYSFSDIKKDGIPITRIETISEGYIDKNKLGYISEALYPYVKKYQLKTGDILFSHINSLEHVGKTAIYNNIPPFLIHGMNLLLLRFKNSMCYPFFLIYLLKKENIRNKIKNLSGQAVNQVSIKPFELSNLKIPLPPLPEQHKIAEILETVDNTIEKTDKIIEKYNRIKQGLMHDLLTKGIDENWQIRNEKTHKFKDSPLGRIPEEWEVVRLGDIADIKLSNVDKKIDLKEKIIRLCNYLEVYQNDYITKGMNFMYASATNNEIKKFKISKGDVIITKDSEEYNDIAKPAYVRDEIENLVCGYHLALVKPLNNINGLFLSKILSFKNVNIYFQKRANGITRFGLTKGIITGAIIPLPPLPEQQRIATVLSQIDEVIEKEKAYKEKLEGIKKGLMEDLLTGKVTVNHLIEEESIDEIG
ncbi:restriction endonuclease subunit S [Thermoanaerobacter uzonensis]|uniref:restriction endonuclease subunit S n=1 Tax=Thermoanaerobacter uzonensis TaxID=447593 RepID=UPI003D766F63